MKKSSYKIDIKSVLLMLLFASIYFSTYLTKKSYAVLLPQIIIETGISQDLLSIPITVLFICYGVAQIFAGIITDRFRSKLILPIALVISGITNYVLPLCIDNVAASSILWGCNALCVCFGWPVIIKYIAGSLEDKYFEKASTMVYIGGLAGQILLYVLAFLFVKFSSYINLFYLSGSFSILVAAILSICSKYLMFDEKEKQSEIDVGESKLSHKKSKQFISVLFIFILFIIVFGGALRDSIESWTPTFINQAFNLTADLGIIASIALPIMSIVFVELSLVLYKKIFKNPIKLATFFGLVDAILIVILYFVGQSSLIATVIILTLIFSITCGLNHTLISFVPKYYKYTNKISTIAGILNAVSYLGSAIATYVIGYISRGDVGGWTGAIICWLAISVSLFIASVITIFLWKNSFKDEK